MKTYWDEEQEKLRDQRKKKELFDVLGRVDRIPKNIVKSVLQTGLSNPEDILKKRGFIFLGEGNGWIKKLNKEYRLHAFVPKAKKSIWMHADKLISRKVHKACKYGVIEEFKQMEPLIQTKAKYNNTILPKAKRIEALKLLRAEKEIKRQSGLKRLWLLIFK